MSPLRTFISYSHKDRDLREAVVEHLTLLSREGILSLWTDHAIGAGDRFDDVIDEKLLEADLVLFLVSSAFLASDYCYGKEMSRSLARHHMNQCRVVPIILRPCDWKTAPFASLHALPTDGQPVTDRRFWHDNDEALAEIAKSLRETVARPIAVNSVSLEDPEQWASNLSSRSQAADATVAAIAERTSRLASGVATFADPDTFRESVVPLMKEFESLHENYLDSFRRYRRILEAHGDYEHGPAAVLDRLESDILFRASNLTRVQELSNQATSGVDAAFITAVSIYLSPPPTDLGLAGILLPVRGLHGNWYGVQARESLGRAFVSTNPGERKRLALSAIDTIVELLQQRYSDVFRAHHQLLQKSRREAGGS